MSCNHPEGEIKISKRTFKDGTTHLERHCGLWGVHRGFERKGKEERRKERLERRQLKSMGSLKTRTAQELLSEDKFFKNLHEEKMGEESQKVDYKKVINWGKYAGLEMTYDDVVEEDRDYFEWILSQPVDPEERVLHKWSRRVRPIIQAALDRNPRKEYIPEVLTGERKDAAVELDNWRTGGLDYIIKQNELRKLT